MRHKRSLLAHPDDHHSFLEAWDGLASKWFIIGELINFLDMLCNVFGKYVVPQPAKTF